MRRPEDLQLGSGLRHALSCEREMDECPECVALRTERRPWPPPRMIAARELPSVKIEFAENFHVSRVKWEQRQAVETAATKQRVKEILRRAR